MLNGTKCKSNLVDFCGSIQKIWIVVIIHVIGETWKSKRKRHLSIFWNNNIQSSNDHLLKEIYTLKHDPLIADQIIETWGYNTYIIGETYNRLVEGFFFEYIMKFKKGYDINYRLKLHTIEYIRVETYYQWKCNINIKPWDMTPKPNHTTLNWQFDYTMQTKHKLQLLQMCFRNRTSWNMLTKLEHDQRYQFRHVVVRCTQIERINNKKKQYETFETLYICQK